MAYQSEIEKLEQRYEENPKQWFAALADAYRKEGRLDLALEYVRGGLEMRPNYASGQIVLGRCLLEKKEYEEASQAFQQVLELDAENIIALKSLSEISESKGDVGGARHWLTRLLEIDPMNDEAVQSLDRLEKIPEPEEVEASAAEAGEEETTGPVLEPGAAWAKEAMAGRAPEQPPETVPDEPVSERAPQIVGEEAAWTPGEEPVLPEEAATSGTDQDIVIERSTGESVFGAETSGAESGTEVEEPGFEVSRAGEASSMAEEAADVSPTAEQPGWGLDDESTAEVPQVEIEALGERDRLDAEYRGEAGADVEETPTATEEAGAEALLASAGEMSGEGGEDADHLDLMSFDEELGWDAGERLSRSITESDIQRAEAEHEELAAPVEFLGDPEAVEARRAGAAARTPESGPVEAEAGEPAEPVEELSAPAWSPPAAEGEVPAEAAAEAAAFDGEPSSGEVEVTDVERLQPAGAGMSEGGEEWPAVGDGAEPGSAEADAAMGADLEQEPDEWGSAPESVDLPLIMPEEGEPAAVGPVEPEPVVTETMAEVYVRQGLYEQARQTYDQLLEQRPGDAELERLRNDAAERAKAAAVTKQVSPYSVAATGGPSVVAYLRGVFDGAAEEEIFQDAGADAPPPDELESGGPETGRSDVERPMSALESAFQEADAEPLGAPTRPAGDEVSLKSVFGSERVPLRPTPVEPTSEPEQSGPPDGVSFDEFYGKHKHEPTEEGDSEGEGREGTDEDFKNWLEGLKT